MDQEDDNDALYDERLAAIAKRVDAAFPNGHVVFEAFDLDEDGLPVDNLDRVAVAGPVVFIAKHDSFFASGRDFQSDTFESPTWLTVVGIANESVACTGDEHHVYLEELVDTGTSINGAQVVELRFGS